MPKLFFTECSPFLRDYVDLDDPDILEDIDVKALSDIDIPDVLRLFARIKLYSHRAGGLFTAQKFWNKFAFRFQIPLYYMINHFFLTDEEVENIQNSPLFQGGNLTNDGTSEEALSDSTLSAIKLVLAIFDLLVFINSKNGTVAQ